LKITIVYNSPSFYNIYFFPITWFFSQDQIFLLSFNVTYDQNLNIIFWKKIRKVKRNRVIVTNSYFLIFQTWIILSNRIHSLKYLRSTTLGCKDIGIRKSEFVAKTQFLWLIKQWNIYLKWEPRKIFLSST